MLRFSNRDAFAAFSGWTTEGALITMQSICWSISVTLILTSSLVVRERLLTEACCQPGTTVPVSNQCELLHSRVEGERLTGLELCRVLSCLGNKYRSIETMRYDTNIAILIRCDILCQHYCSWLDDGVRYMYPETDWLLSPAYKVTTCDVWWQIRKTRFSVLSRATGKWVTAVILLKVQTSNVVLVKHSSHS